MAGRSTKKYHLARWTENWQLKEQGGLRVVNLNIMIKALLDSWIWKLETFLWGVSIYPANEIIKKKMHFKG